MATIDRTSRGGGGAVLRVLALSAAVVTGTATGVARTSPQSLSRLTVPPAALPDGCAPESLEPPAATPTRLGSPAIRMWSGVSFPANPWSGTEPRFVAIVRGAIDPSPRAPLPDGQLIEAESAPAFLAARAEGVIEAYRAVYLSPDGHRVQVSAVTFDDASLVREEPVSMLTNPPRGQRRRVARGATVAVVSAPAPGACARAVEAHVRSVL